jgi:formylglycine-generating enzyme required for sulfatase activity
LIAASPKIRLDLETVNVGTDDEFLPMTYITYPQVQEFCERFSRDLSQEYGRSIIVRLPTEAEWEYSCRAGSETRFGGGNSEDKDFANTENLPAIDEGNWKGAPKWAKDLRKLFEGADNFRLTRSISKFDANPFGLAAMNGNVWEMVSDSWHEDFKSNAPTGGSAWEKVDARNPAHSQKSFVLKGGAFSRDTYMAQCSYRALGTMTTQGNEQTGFRIVIEAEAIDDLFPSNAPLK